MLKSILPLKLTFSVEIDFDVFDFGVGVEVEFDSKCPLKFVDVGSNVGVEVDVAAEVDV